MGKEKREKIKVNFSHLFNDFSVIQMAYKRMIRLCKIIKFKNMEGRVLNC
jgi:hypothetical protein